MMGPSDLNRLARWTPSRQPEELARYASLELGGQVFETNGRARAAPPFRGFRAWLATHRPFARAAVEPLRSNLAAVHFDGEIRAERRAAFVPSGEPLVGLATPGMEGSLRDRDNCPEDRLACEH